MMQRKGVQVSMQWRFTATLLHMVSILLVFYSKKINILSSGIKLNTLDYDQADVIIVSIASSSLICFIVELVGLFSGLSVFYPALNFFHAMMHSLGFFFTIWFLSEGWNYKSLVFLFLLFSFVPAIVEGFHIAYHFIVKIRLIKQSTNIVNKGLNTIHDTIH